VSVVSCIILALLSYVATGQEKIREPSVVSISLDSEIEVVKGPSKTSMKPAVRAIAVKKRHVPVTIDSDENSDNQMFIDDSAVVDDESAKRSFNVVIHYEQ
jgi:ribosomal protein L6P/L9E